MRKNNFIFTVAILFLLPLMAQCNNIITIGTIDEEPENKFKKFEIFSKYLEKKLNKDNLKVSIEIPKDIETTINLINNNKLDIFIDSVYPTILVQKQTGITIETKRWKSGQEGYKSVIFVKKDSDIYTLKDLAGKTITFENEFSTSGFYIPKKEIEKSNLVLSNEEKENGIKYNFSKSEENAAIWVLFGKVDAAAVDDFTFTTFDKKLYKIIHTSQLVPRHLVSFSKSVDENTKKEILDILHSMHEDEEGKEVLKSFSKTKKFTKFNDEELKALGW